MKRFDAMAIGGLALLIGFTGCSSKVEVPALAGLEIKAATARLQAAGLQAGPVQNEFTGTQNSGIVLRQTPSAATRVAKGAAIQLTVEESITVPSLVGMDYASAARMLENQGLRLQRLEKKFVGGTLSNVVDQAPISGTRVAASSGVDLTIDEFVVVPDYVGQKYDDIRRSVSQTGLRLGKKIAKAAGKKAPGTVLDQVPDVGSKVAPGTAIDLALAAAPDEVVSKGAGTKLNNGGFADSKGNKADPWIGVAETLLDQAKIGRAHV